MTDELVPNPNSQQFLLFSTDDGRVQIQCRFEGETLWLPQSAIAELYQVTPQAITQHIKSIYEDEELDENSTCKDYLQVQREGSREVKRQVRHYSLPVILAIGYRVRSTRGTQFRQWATRTLGEYLTKGFVMDDERLKNPTVGHSAAPDYFDELLERIRDIRASERRMYLRVREIFALAADYEPSLKETTEFFKVIQNKLHFATTGLTAAELIYTRADASKPNMGLTSFKGGEVRKGDITTAKNYLAEKEIQQLNRIVTMWLDFAEDQAARKKQIFLKDWVTKLDEFLVFNDRDVLENAGRVTKKAADEKATEEFEKFSQERRRIREAKGADSLTELLKARDLIQREKDKN